MALVSRAQRKIDDYKDHLRDRIAAVGKIWLPATVLLREICAQGYEGGITQLKEFLRELRPRQPEEPIKRFETEPGKQPQIDLVIFRRGNFLATNASPNVDPSRVRLWRRGE